MSFNVALGLVCGGCKRLNCFPLIFSNVSSTQHWGLLTLMALGSNYGWESAVVPCQHPGFGIARQAAAEHREKDETV